MNYLIHKSNDFSKIRQIIRLFLSKFPFLNQKVKENKMRNLRGLVLGIVMMIVGIGLTTTMLDNQLQKVISFQGVGNEIGFTTVMFIIGMMGMVIVWDELKNNQK